MASGDSGAGATAPEPPSNSAATRRKEVQAAFRQRQKAKVQDLEAEVSGLRDRAQRLELDKSRQEAELDLLRRLVARHGQPSEADAAAAARVGQLETYVLQLEARQRVLEAQREQGLLAERGAAARVQQLEALVQQLESRLQAERRAGQQAAQLQATVRRLEAEAQRAQVDRARDRAQLDAMHDSQRATAAHIQATGGAAQLDDEGAEGFAQLLAMVRGAGAVGTIAIECKAITPLVLVDLQKETRRHFEALLQLGAGVSGSPAAEQLAQLVRQYLQCMFHTWRHCFALYQGYTQIVMKHVQSLGPPPAASADRMLATLNLSEPQTDAICEAYGAMSAALNEVYREQKAMISSISRPQQHGLLGEQLLELQRVSGRLQGILRDYHVAFDLDILTPAQFARGVVAAHPYFLNPMMLGGALATSRGHIPGAGEDSGMEQVLTWLFADGSSSIAGRDAVAAPQDMSVSSLQDALEAIDDLGDGFSDDVDAHGHPLHPTLDDDLANWPLGQDPLRRAAEELMDGHDSAAAAGGNSSAGVEHSDRIHLAATSGDDSRTVSG